MSQTAFAKRVTYRFRISMILKGRRIPYLHERQDCKKLGLPEMGLIQLAPSDSL